MFYVEYTRHLLLKFSQSKKHVRYFNRILEYEKERKLLSIVIIYNFL